MFLSARILRQVPTVFAVVGLSALVCVAPASAVTLYSTGFEDFTALAGQGWTFQNNSTPVGTTGWFQGNATVFSTPNGPANSYLGANYNNTTGTNTISNWAITPTQTYQNGDTFTFITKSAGSYADRLSVRLSTNGSSANVGSTNSSVGDFTTSLLTINQALTASGYPTTWTQYTATISGLAAPTSGRIAFNYNVTNGGPTGANSNFIGIDSLSILRDTTPPPPPPPPTPPTSKPIGVPGSVVGTLAGATIDWYSFVNPGGNITIDTIGSSLTPSNDTEIALYNSAGTLLGMNDDGTGIGFLSSATFNLLTPGERYYIAVAGYNLNNAFNGDFGAVSASTNTGSYRLNVSSTIPESGTVALLGIGVTMIGGLLVRRNRRA